MIIVLVCFLLIIIIVAVFIRQPKFGKAPQGQQLQKIKKSPYYKKGSFQNLSPTPALTEGVSYYAVIKEFFFSSRKRVKPVDAIPSQKTDLLILDRNKDVLVWFGHSSYFIQADGKKILVDPVLNGTASPLSFTTKAFNGTNGYTADDIPEIDYLFITHDHWDHLDYLTLQQLKPKIKKIICGLGTGEHLQRWGYDKNIIIEKDWNEKTVLDNGYTTHAVPARHFSGRGFRRNRSLWTSFVLQTPTNNIFIGGDSGYDTHFTEIGKTFGPFDLVILENGQYDKSWKYIHMMPEEVLQAAKDLRAKRLLPVHSSKFALANHAWDDPLKTITALHKDVNLQLLTPMIGEQVNLKAHTQVFSQWWKDVN
jgi:L-ascorbate metabolism protein UlaG (beta-lactamase superfamily)